MPPSPTTISMQQPMFPEMQSVSTGNIAKILAACQADDPPRAANAVRHHIQQTIIHVKNVLEHDRKA